MARRRWVHTPMTLLAGIALGGLFIETAGAADLTWTTPGPASGQSPQQIFSGCTGCHRTGPGGLADWLDLTDPLKLRRASYYARGKTKAEASIIRVTDGTMPPGQIRPDVPSPNPAWSGAQISDVQAWINQGMRP